MTFTVWQLLAATGLGFIMGAALAGLVMYWFWHGFFHGFVVELTAGLARMVAAECARNTGE